MNGNELLKEAEKTGTKMDIGNRVKICVTDRPTDMTSFGYERTHKKENIDVKGRQSTTATLQSLDS